MKKFSLYILSLFLIVTIQSCITSDYNLGKDINGSICFAPGGFSLAGDNSADVPLSEVIELNDSGELTTDEEGNYLFYKLGNTMEPTTIVVGQGSLCDAFEMTPTMSFGSDATIEPSKRYSGYSNLSFSVNSTLASEPDDQNESVRELIYVTTPMTVTIQTTIDASAAKFCNYINITYELPSFYDVKDASELTETIKMGEFGTIHEHIIHLKGVDFTKHEKSDERIGIEHPSGKMYIDGSIKIHGKTIVNTSNYQSVISSRPKIDFIIGVSTMGTNLVTGRFDKKEDVDVDPITLDNLPDFIRDDEVVVDVENPVVRVTLDNEVPADVSLDARLMSYKNGKYIAEVDAGKKYGTDPILFYGATDTQPVRRTNIWISRIPTAIPDSVSKNVVISNMNNLIRKVPERVDVLAQASTDSTVVLTLALGKEYTASPQYELVAPLKIGPEMKIVYAKDLEDLHDHTKNMELSGLEFSGDITNNIPLDLHLVVSPLDGNGNVLENIKINTPDIIPAYSTKSVTFTMESDDPLEIQKIYTVKMRAYAESNEGLAGKYLNKDQNMRIDHALIKLLGAKYNVLGD